jgi:lysyl-tRNA synthetase class 1
LFEHELNPEELQTAIYEKSKEKELKSTDAFKAIYTAFLGKDHGPKAAWLLQSLDKEFVKKRLNDI